MPGLVKVLNKSDSEFADSFDNTRFVIAPGKESLVPEEAAHLWFGYPPAIDNDREPARLNEFKRLKTLYGAYDDPELWERNKPNVEIYDMEGNRIVTIIDDPTGETVTPARQSVSEVDLLRQAMEEQQRQLDSMRHQLAARERATQALEVEIPTDTPENAPKTRKRPSDTSED